MDLLQLSREMMFHAWYIYTAVSVLSSAIENQLLSRESNT